MDTWVWPAILAAAAVGLFALVWWSSGRARPLDRAPGSPLTQSQLERGHQIISQNQHGAGPG